MSAATVGLGCDCCHDSDGRVLLRTGGKYQTEGHCQADCAYEGVQMLDTCGGQAGRIEQTVQGTTAGSEYVLSYALSAHQGCGDGRKVMQVFVDGRQIAEERFKRSGNWADHKREHSNGSACAVTATLTRL